MVAVSYVFVWYVEIGFGGLGPVVSGTVSRGEANQGGLGTVCYG